MLARMHALCTLLLIATLLTSMIYINIRSPVVARMPGNFRGTTYDWWEKERSALEGLDRALVNV